MILFISKYPNLETDPSGWLQRVAAMDEFFNNKKRIYLDISFRKNLLPKLVYQENNLKTYKLNFFLHFLIILYFSLKSKYLYVHTLGNATKVIPFYFFRKVITDMHGIPPEEMKYCYKNNWASVFYNVVERFVIRKSYKIIAVTNAMKNHYKNKYGKIKAEILVIPIFDNYKPENRLQRNPDEKYSIIYSGGVEKWQNVDFMLETIAKIKDKFTFTILTGREEEFKVFLENYGLSNYIDPVRVTKNEVYNYYLRSDFGFILREGNIVNKVACPTKLVEYLVCGVIPIVLQPEIGDFNEFKYSYLTAEDIINGNIPAPEEINIMRNNNYAVMQNLRNITASSIKELMEGL